MDAVEEVKQRLSIEDVVSEYVQLKRAGRNWRGLSPWTSEKTASMMVSPDKQIWHDFSSGKGGNIFSFVMEMEGLDFKAALELLARKAGVDLEQYRSASGASRGPNKEKLYEANEAAAHFYQVQFSKNQTALEYVFKKREFVKETALAWRLGYSPASGEALANYLKSKKFTSDEIKRAGLASAYGRDMFRGRLMIPLADQQGRIIGFTARILADDHPPAGGAPKYINTPSTAIYDKSRHVYGLHLAKDAIRKTNFVVLAEGNLDVIASHQAGVANVVATAGTALTEQNLKTLARFTPDIRLCFDADKAGLAATERAIPLAGKVGASLSIIDIPSGKDPDELIKQDKAKWQEIIDRPKYALDWLVGQYQQRLDLTSAQGKREFSDVLLPVVKALEDKVEQDHYLNQIAKLIDGSVESLKEKMASGKEMQSAPRRRQKEPPKLTQDEKLVADRHKTEEYLLAILLNQPKLLKDVSIISPDMLNPTSQDVWKLINEPDFDPKINKQLAEQNLADYVTMLGLEFEELYQGLETSELTYEVSRLQARLIEQYVKTRKSLLAAEFASADEAKNDQLLAEARGLDNLLKQAIRRD